MLGLGLVCSPNRGNIHREYLLLETSRKLTVLMHFTALQESLSTLYWSKTFTAT